MESTPVDPGCLDAFITRCIISNPRVVCQLDLLYLGLFLYVDVIYYFPQIAVRQAYVTYTNVNNKNTINNDRLFFRSLIHDNAVGGAIQSIGARGP